jgi:hypothetical protein
MSSTKLEVEYVAELARINLTPEEVRTFRSQLEIVLQHVERLNQVDVSHVEPMALTVFRFIMYSGMTNYAKVWTAKPHWRMHRVGRRDCSWSQKSWSKIDC